MKGAAQDQKAGRGGVKDPRSGPGPILEARPIERTPAGELLMQQPASLAGFLKPHQGAGSGIAIESDAPADPALEHIVENLDLCHGHNGGGPGPEAVPRKGWPGSFATRPTLQPIPCGG